MSPIEVRVENGGWRSTPGLPALVERAVRAALGLGRASAEVFVLLSDDRAVRSLNARFRGKDVPTNVLSFPAHASAAPHLGDLVLAYGVCRREAIEQSKPLTHHLQHLVVHGVLHLLGHDHGHDEEAEAMEAAERRVLRDLGVPDPYALRPSHG